MTAEHTGLEIENGFRQFDLCLNIIGYYLHPDRPFALRPNILLQLQELAVEGIEATAGKFRPGPVGIHQSKHIPPDAHLVETHVRELCDYINDNWHEQTAFHLAAYAMWRVNWIHAFTDGNGRTSRCLSYIILCIKLGYVLPGSPTIPQQIEEDKSFYVTALEAADEACRAGLTDVSSLEAMLKDMLARQLLGVIEAAGGEALLGRSG